MPIINTNKKGMDYWFPLMGSDGAKSLGTEAIDASSLVSNYG